MKRRSRYGAVEGDDDMEEETPKRQARQGSLRGHQAPLQAFFEAKGSSSRVVVSGDVSGKFAGNQRGMSNNQ